MPIHPTFSLRHSKSLFPAQEQSVGLPNQTSSGPKRRGEGEDPFQTLTICVAFPFIVKETCPQKVRALADTEVVQETSYSERASDTADINSLANSASQSIPCDVPHVN